METIMKYNHYMKKIIILSILTQFLLAYEVPSNSLNNRTLNRWVLVKHDLLSKNEEKDLIKNPKSFIQNSKNKKTSDSETRVFDSWTCSYGF